MSKSVAALTCVAFLLIGGWAITRGPFASDHPERSGTTTTASASEDRRLGAQAHESRREPKKGVNRKAFHTHVPLPLPPPSTPVAQLLPELDARARGGDAAAACRLGAELMECSGLPQRERELLNYKEKMLKREPLPDPEKEKTRLALEVDWLARSEAMLESSEKHCAGVDEKHWIDIYDYQRIAAASGHLPSMRFLLFRPALELDVFAQIEQYRRFPDDARRVLERTVRAGDTRVLAGLLRAHRVHAYTRRFEMRTYQAMFQSPAELEVYLEVARMADISDMPPTPGQTPSESPPSLCPGDSRCPAIKRRAESIVADLRRNLNDVAAFDSSGRGQPTFPGQTCEQINESR